MRANARSSFLARYNCERFFDGDKTLCDCDARTAGGLCARLPADMPQVMCLPASTCTHLGEPCAGLI